MSNLNDSIGVVNSECKPHRGRKTRSSMLRTAIERMEARRPIILPTLYEFSARYAPHVSNNYAVFNTTNVDSFVYNGDDIPFEVSKLYTYNIKIEASKINVDWDTPPGEDGSYEYLITNKIPMEYYFNPFKTTSVTIDTSEVDGEFGVDYYIGLIYNIVGVSAVLPADAEEDFGDDLQIYDNKLVLDFSPLTSANDLELMIYNYKIIPCLLKIKEDGGYELMDTNLKIKSYIAKNNNINIKTSTLYKDSSNYDDIFIDTFMPIQGLDAIFKPKSDDYRVTKDSKIVVDLVANDLVLSSDSFLLGLLLDGSLDENELFIIDYDNNCIYFNNSLNNDGSNLIESFLIVATLLLLSLTLSPLPINTSIPSTITDMNIARVNAGMFIRFVDVDTEMISYNSQIYYDDTITINKGNAGNATIKYIENKSKQTPSFVSTCITDVVIPSGITVIPDGAFAQSSLQTIEIPETVTHVGYDAFYGCDDLSQITSHAQSCPTLETTIYSAYANYGIIHYPQGSDYSSWFDDSEYGYIDSNWFAKEMGVDLPELTLDGYDMVALFQGLRELKLCSDISNITNICVDGVEITPALYHTFNDLNWHIVHYKFKNTIIPISAFSSCNKMYAFKLSDTITGISYNSFDGCYGLRKIELGAGVTTVSDSLFEDCYHLEEIVVSPNNQTYDSRNNCNAIIETSTNTLVVGCKNTKIPNTVVNIGKNAFKHKYIRTMNIPNSVTSIGYAAFFNCPILENITIPSSVNAIEEHAFSCNYKLLSCDIKGSPAIARLAFCRCTSLCNLNLGNTTFIGDFAFHDCNSLTQITIPSTVTYVGNSIFSNCGNLTQLSVNRYNSTYDSRNNCNAIIRTSDNTIVSGCKYTTIPNTVVSIGDYSLCSVQIPKIDIPSSVTYIGVEAFSRNFVLREINIPDSVVYMGFGAFGLCLSLTHATLGNGLTVIPSSCFEGSGLREITITPNIIKIGNSAFESCALQDIIIPDNVLSIGSSAFEDCSSLTGVTIGTGLTNLANCIFNRCDSLTEINIPDNITTIYGYAFEGCSGLTSVTIGTGITSIYDNSFSGCTSLNSITCKAATCPSISSYAFSEIGTNGFLYYPEDSNYNYWVNLLKPYGWTGVPTDMSPLQLNGYNMVALFQRRNDTGVTKLFAFDIGNNSAYIRKILVDGEPIDLSTVSTFKFNDDNVHIVHYDIDYVITGLFYNCYDMREARLSDKIVSIGNSAFQYSGLNNIILPDGLLEIADHAFQGTGIRNLTLGRDIQNLQEWSLHINALESITCKSYNPPILDNNVVNSPKRNGCLYHPTGSDYSTWYNKQLKYYDWTTQEIVGDGLSLNGYDMAVAFQTNNNTTPTMLYNPTTSNISEITIDGMSIALSTGYTFTDSEKHIVRYKFVNSTTIDAGTFSGCTAMREIHLSNEITKIDDRGFEECNNLTYITMSTNIETIGKYAFSNCWRLPSIILGDKLTFVDDYAFNGCTNLTRIIANALTVPTLGNNVFNGIGSNGRLFKPGRSSGANYSSWLSELPDSWLPWDTTWYYYLKK